MKPNTLINTSDEQTLRNQYTHDVVTQNDDSSLFGKILMGIACIVIAFSSYIIMPHFLSQFKQSSPRLQIAEQETKQTIPLKHLDAYLWTAKLKLEDLKLNHRLAISLSDENNLRITGIISMQETANWQSFQEWYKTKEGFPKLVHSVNANASSGDIPELKSVWFDANPTAYFVDGRFGKIGAVLDDGWKIVSIEAWAVFVERNGTTIALNY